VFQVCGGEPLVEVALALEKAALNDDYFISRKLYPNVDFYSGLIYKGYSFINEWSNGNFLIAMGFPPDFFPLLFAIPRISGWLAHWKEQLEDPKGVRIWRPRQIYNGVSERPFVPLDLRKETQEGHVSKTLSDGHAMYKRYQLSRGPCKHHR